ncbi:MAG: hypothetical protein PHD57_06820 [Desulfobacterales bacterium]|nr:hypothetical protein [Desulfobacterales bacterium]
METKPIDAETATKMTETELMDAVWEAPDNSILEIFVVDPDSPAGDNDGILLEVVKLDDEESVVRDRWPTQDGGRHLVSTSDIYAIYRALVDQVEEVA